MHTHSPNKPKKFKQTLPACQKADGNCFQDMRGVLMVELMQHGTKITSEVYCETLKNCVGPAIQNILCCLSMTVSIRIELLMLEHCCSHFNQGLFDHPPHSPDLSLRYHHLFKYLKKWLLSQHFNNNEELMEGVETWLSRQAADFFDTGIQNLFDTTSASVLAVNTLRSSLSMYVFFVYNKIFFSLLVLLTAQWRLLSK
jgi:hypothetical protein